MDFPRAGQLRARVLGRDGVRDRLQLGPGSHHQAGGAGRVSAGMFTLYVVFPGFTAPGYHRLGVCPNVSGREHFVKGVVKRAIDSAQLRARGVSLPLAPCECRRRALPVKPIGTRTTDAIQKTINAAFTAGPGTTVYFYAGRCTSRRPVERNRKYRWPQSSHRNGLIRRSAHTILSSVPFLWDLRTQLPPHRGQMLCSAECRKLIKPPSFQGLGGGIVYL